MALTNCTINSTSVEVTPSQALGSGVANQVLTITPNTGYRVAAADFAQNTDLSAVPFVNQINNITLTNSGTAYAESNKVIVTIDLKDTFNPGTNNHTFTIDIDGAAVLEKNIPKTLSGVFNVTVNNATTAASNQAYSATATSGTTVDLFTRTVTATSGNYFEVAPTIEVATGNVDNYVITATPNGTGTNHTATTFNVDGIIPLITDTSDVINIDARAVTIPVALNRINSYSMDTSDAPYVLTKRGLTVYGDVGAKFEVNITRTGDSHTYDFSAGNFTSSNTNSGTLTIGSNGQHAQLITLPLVVADVTYTITISEKPPTADNISQTNPFTINRRGFKTVTASASSTSRGTLSSVASTYTNYAGTTINHSAGANAINGQSGTEIESNNGAEFNFVTVIQDDQAFTFSGTNALSSSMTLTSSHYGITGNANIVAGTITAVRSADNSGNANRKLTITGTDWYNWQHGTSNTVINFNIDQFCDAGGSNPGGSNVLTIGNTQFQDVTGGNSTILYPSGYIQGVTGRTSGSSTITYTLAGVQLSSNDFPSYVDTSGDVTITAGNYGATTTKFNSANYATSLTSFNVANQGTSSRVLTMDITVTITSFSPNVAANDVHNLKVMIAFANDGANP